MAKKKRKTIKIEIPVPELPKKLPDKLPKKLPGKEEIAKSVDLEKSKEAIRKNIPKQVDVEMIKQRLMQNRSLAKAAAVVIVAIIGISVILYAQSLPPSSPLPRKVYSTKTVTETVPVNLSFADFIAGYLDHEDESVTVMGFLVDRIQAAPGGGTMGIHYYYVMDDSGNEIHLTDLSSRDKGMFAVDGKTEGLYNVTGVVRTKFQGFDLEVTGIAPATRPTVTMEKEVTTVEYVY